MVEHRLDVIERTVAKTYEWVHRVAERANLDDSHRAYQVLRAVLHSLRDRVGPDVAAHLAAQLPLLVRGIYYEGWDPGKSPVRMGLPEFVARVEMEANLKGTSQSEDAVRAVLSVCRDEFSPGTMDHLASVLPREYHRVL